MTEDVGYISFTFKIPFDEDGYLDLGNNNRVHRDVLLPALESWISGSSVSLVDRREKDE